MTDTSTAKRKVASSAVRRPGWRRRLPTAVVALGSVAAIAAALTAAVTPVPGLDFLHSGHWVYNLVTGYAVHVDGGSPSTDASVKVDAEPGAQVVQGPGTGYVVDKHKITVFGTSSLSVEEEVAAPSDEQPLAVEAVGGPYFFYRDAGKIVRLGEQPTSIRTSGSFTDPVITSDGTIWLYRPADRTICSLGRDATMLGSCPAELQPGHTGSLTLVRDRPMVLDTVADALYPVTDKGIGGGHGIGDGVSDNAELASSDVDGRVVILDPDKHEMRMLDPNEPSDHPVTVPLAAGGHYAAPSSTGSAVAVVDQQAGTVRTYDVRGNQKDERALPKDDSAQARVSKGEDDRIYVESGQGTQVVVVDRDGTLSDVPVAIDPKADPGKEKAKPEKDEKPVPGTTPPPEHDERTTPQPSHDTPPQRQDAEPDRPERVVTPVVPASPPGAPPGVAATAGNASATVSWGAAEDNRAAITQYRISWTSTGGRTGSTTTGGSSRSAKITGLTNGDRYTISVAAVNAKGRGAPTAADAVTPVAAAAAPGGLTVDVSGTDASVRWTRPDLAGGTLDHYRVTATGQSAKTVTGTSTTFSGLVPGSSFTVTVRAVTTTSDGRTLNGATASKTVAVPGPVVTVTRGQEGCPDYDEPDCAWMHVHATGLTPGAHYEFDPHADDPDYSNPGSGQNADADGVVDFEAFQYFGTGHLIWVTADDSSGNLVATSQKIRWE